MLKELYPRNYTWGASSVPEPDIIDAVLNFEPEHGAILEWNSGGEKESERKKVKSISRARLFATAWIVACTKLLRPWDFQGKSTGVGCHFLLQGIFPTQGSNPGLSHCRQTLYHLSHQGSPGWLVRSGEEGPQRRDGCTLHVGGMWIVWLRRQILKGDCSVSHSTCFSRDSALSFWEVDYYVLLKVCGSLWLSWSVKVLVTQSCLTLCDPMDSSPPGSSVHRILQARIQKWVAIPFSRGSSQPRDWTWVYSIAGRYFTIWATREAQLDQ